MAVDGRTFLCNASTVDVDEDSVTVESNIFEIRHVMRLIMYEDTKKYYAIFHLNKCNLRVYTI